MSRGRLLALALLAGAAGGVGATEQPPAATTRATDGAVEAPAPPSATGNPAAEQRRKNILLGRASLADVRKALTEQDVAALTNTLHALFAMRWHRGVLHLLDGLWAGNRAAYPELAWDLIAQPPARVALASTLNRIQIVDTKAFQDYIRSQRDNSHEFVRAQVAVALGFNGDPVDIPLLRSYAEGENRYVVQTAVTGLGLMESEQAKQALIDIGNAFTEKEPERSRFVAEVLKRVYHWPPATPQPPAPQAQ